MSDQFVIIEVPEGEWDRTKREALGTKFKFWFEDSSKERFLYKEGRPDSGEDWSEKVVAELCELLAIPHAEYEFAIWNDPKNGPRMGVVSRSFIGRQGVFLPGMIFLRLSTEQPVDEVLALLRHVNPPVRGELETTRPGLYQKDTVGYFIGYLMLDAWVGNTDRHSENWGFIDESNANAAPFALAPTFDHASSLGVRLSDTDRQERISNSAVDFALALLKENRNNLLEVLR